MRLLLNSASPYARLVRVILEETALAADCGLHYLDPWLSADDLLSVNPAAKVPALELDDGICIIESSCICDYLIGYSRRDDLNPACSDVSASRLYLLGLGRAAMDCAFGSVLLRRFAEPDMLATRWVDALPRIAHGLEEALSRSARRAPLDLSDFTIAVACEYLDFRLPDVNWRESNPLLARHVAELADRRSMSSTKLH